MLGVRIFIESNNHSRKRVENQVIHLPMKFFLLQKLDLLAMNYFLKQNQLRGFLPE